MNDLQKNLKLEITSPFGLNGRRGQKKANLAFENAELAKLVLTNWERRINTFGLQIS